MRAARRGNLWRRAPILLAIAGLVAAWLPSIRASVAGVPWNVVVIMTDDLDAGTLQTAAHPPQPCDHCSFMPNYITLFEQNGIRFSNSFVTYSLCCPSRATFFSGQYAHVHNVKNNEGPSGGCTQFSDTNTLATWLTPTYTTSLVGKYLNLYGTNSNYVDCRSPTYIPAGWDQWHGLTGTVTLQYGYGINDNGTRCASPGCSDYQTVALRKRAVSFINNAATQGPFFLYVAPSAPHLDGGASVICSDPGSWGDLRTIRDDPAYDGSAAGLTLSHPPSWNEVEATKPSFLQSLPDVDMGVTGCTQTIWRDRIESLQSIDDMIGAIATALQTNGVMNNTVMIFTSDNGYYNGEHKLHEKILPYEEGLRVPLAIEDPGTPASLKGTTKTDFVLNTDLAPTIAALAGVSPSLGVDGQSLVPLLTGSSGWIPRQRFMLEHWAPGSGSQDPSASDPHDPYPNFFGLRTASTAVPDPSDVMYSEYASADNEYYIGSDQYELTNQCGILTTCPISITGPSPYKYLKLFMTGDGGSINGLETCNAGAAYTCQRLEQALTWPP